MKKFTLEQAIKLATHMAERAKSFNSELDEQDMISDAIYAAWQAFLQIKPGIEKPERLVVRAVKARLIDNYRKNKTWNNMKNHFYIREVEDYEKVTDCIDFIEHMSRKLSHSEQQLFYMQFFLNMSSEEIALKWKVSERKIQRIRKKAFSKIRRIYGKVDFSD